MRRPLLAACVVCLAAVAFSGFGCSGTPAVSSRVDAAPSDGRSEPTSSAPSAVPPASAVATNSLRPGGALRAAILEGLRPSVERQLKQRVKFVVVIMAASPSFAYVNARPIRPDGSAIDYRKIARFRKAIDAGMFDDGIEALLRRSDGTWRVVELRVGPTDTALDDWKQKHDIAWTQRWEIP